MASQDATDGSAPRRSSRISAQPKVETKSAPAAKKQVRKASTKRAAEGSDKDEEKNKKAKADEEPKVASDDNGGDQSTVQESVPNISPLDIGDLLPSITVKNEKGEDIDVASLAATNGVVFFLVPKADTPGCTTQACGFRDIWKEFTDLHFDVYGVSADTPAAQTKWQTKKELPYSLLSDPKRVFIGVLGAADGNKTKRSHFVFGAGGKLLDRKMPVKPVDSPRLAVEFIKSIA
ncbi:thioredoxin-like protein [Hygrophoropsis aurantiaca]|uniref:Thioredoxin-like protein n=1 Tax=Hygrophoropsis aurantiaca TaxID=72124 RepID=A0ACB8AQU7_9AGAM|nr:thioredoxin-like protein [Hygrophoropsis aurantiaca]